MFKKISLLTILLFPLQSTMAQEEVRYRVSFKGNFSSSNQPSSRFPADPHFSPLVVATHNKKYNMFPSNTKATKGVKNVAETGNPKVLLSELSNAQRKNNILDFERGRPLNGTESDSIIITASKDNAYLSVITMIAPSPDWIIGVSGLPLKENGSFFKRRSIPLYPIDAGTDSGKYYGSANKKTSPQAPIHLLKKINGIGIQAPYGFMTIEKI